MQWNKRQELKIQHDTLYYIDQIADKVIINTGNASIRILTNTLDLVQDLYLIDNLHIGQTYKKFSNDALLLYCQHNACFIYISLRDFSVRIIKLHEKARREQLLPLYYWDDIFCIVATAQGLYAIHRDEHKMDPLPETIVEQELGVFYRIWHTYRERENMIHYYPKEQVMIFKEPWGVYSESYDAAHHRKPIVAYADMHIQEADYNRGDVLLIYRDKIDFVPAHNHAIPLDCPTLWVFIMARFIDTSVKKVVTLAQSTTHAQEYMVAVYDLG